MRRWLLPDEYINPPETERWRKIEKAWLEKNPPPKTKEEISTPEGREWTRRHKELQAWAEDQGIRTRPEPRAHPMMQPRHVPKVKPHRPVGITDEQWARAQKIRAGIEAGMSKEEIRLKMNPELIEPRFGLPTPIRRPISSKRPRRPKPRPPKGGRILPRTPAKHKQPDMRYLCNKPTKSNVTKAIPKPTSKPRPPSKR